MSIELLTKSENSTDLKEILKNIDNVKPNIDIYSLIVEEQMLIASA